MFRLITACLIALSLNASPLLAAEEAPEFKSERGNYLIGDIISLKLELEGSGYQLGAMDEEYLAPFELTGSQAAYNPETDITTLTAQGHIFETGEITIPPLTILNKDGSSVKSAELKVVITPVLKGDESDIRAMKPQVAVDENGPLWPWLLSALFAALILALILYIKRLRDKKGEGEVTATAIPPHIEAMEELSRIEAMNLIREGRLKELYTLVSDVIRIFEGKSHGFDAMEMTTEELVRKIRAKAGSSRDIAESNRAEEEREILKLERFLRDCDMVKFARHRPADMDISALCDRAREIVKARQLIKDKASFTEEGAEGEAADFLPEGDKPKGEITDAT